jgi:hypothetical protein
MPETGLKMLTKLIAQTVSYYRMPIVQIAFAEYSR